ncbi:MAG: glycosyltransferase family 4 protein [Hyphomonadaceae bacterium]
MLADFLIAAAAAFAASALACRAVIAAGVWDAPTAARKAHREPTPTSAGLAIGIGYALGICALVYPPVRDWSAEISARAALHTSIAMAAAFVFLAIGTLDDLRPVSARVKLLLFALASLAVPIFAMRAEFIPLGAGAVIPLHIVVAVIGSALWVFTLVNAVNFMDGANGLALGSTAIGLVFLGLIAGDAGRMQTAALCFCGAGAIAGFLVWNFPTGKLFAGDSGALFAGAIAAIGSLLVVRSGLVSPFVPPILFFPMLADVLLTLAWRVSHGADVFTGHREHFYQIGLRSGLSHTQIALRYWALATGCGVLGFIAARAGRGDIGAPFADPEALTAIAAILSYAPLAAFIVCVLVALIASARIRAFARAQGFRDD